MQKGKQKRHKARPVNQDRCDEELCFCNNQFSNQERILFVKFHHSFILMDPNKSIHFISKPTTKKALSTESSLIFKRRKVLMPEVSRAGVTSRWASSEKEALRDWPAEPAGVCTLQEQRSLGQGNNMTSLMNSINKRFLKTPLTIS